MTRIRIEEPEDRRMDAKRIRDIRQRLSKEYENLIGSINRNRFAEQIKQENAADKGDLAAIDHGEGFLYNLHEGDFMRLRFVQEALMALDRGQYGECAGCGKDINDKVLRAVPWATLCTRCQEVS